jgi:hypothetical protein
MRILQHEMKLDKLLPNCAGATVKHILVSTRSQLLETCIIGVLKNSDELDVRSISPDDMAGANIASMQPPLVILESSASHVEPAQLLEVLDRYARFRILLVHPDTNVVHVYDKREITLESGVDLVKLICHA